MKPVRKRSLIKTFVAPHAGAWIETQDLGCGVVTPHVAPHAGAWIETPLLDDMPRR